jgi:NAD(P)-dependent dehydrogenase (short-subunit alcohol dehydrogenase family)
MEAVLRAGVIVAVFLALLAGFAIRVQQFTFGPTGFGYSTMPEDLMGNFSAQEFEGKVALVTGASSGIGWETAQALASKGFHVIVMARTYPKAENAIARLKDHFAKAKLREPRLSALACDLGSLGEIEAAVQTFEDMRLPLHLLINNAATRTSSALQTVDGFEMQMGVNYFGHFHLTTLLLPFLTNSKPARVVTLASTLHRLSSGAFVTSPGSPHENALAAYADSKMALIVATQNLHNQNYQSGVSFYAVSPGFSSEYLEGNMFSLLSQLGGRAFFNSITARKSPHHGSASVLYAALWAPQSHSGTYFENCNIKDPKNLKIMHEATMLQDFGNETVQLIQDKIRLSIADMPETARSRINAI